MLILALCVAVGVPIDVSYHGPKEPGSAEAYMPYVWEPGTVATTVKDTSLQASVSADDAEQFDVPFGSRVTITARTGELVREGDRFDYWYEATYKNDKGFIFGADLTPAAYEGDFDGDRKPELLTVSWTSDYKVRIRYSGQGVLKELDLTPAGQSIGCCGGVAHTEMIDRKVAGVPLLKVATDAEACGDTAVAFVSIVGGEPRLALEVAGLADPPSMCVSTFEYARRELTVVTSTSDGDAPKPKITRQHYVLKRGRYVKADAKR